MIKLVEMTYEEFLQLKEQKYSSTAIIKLICSKLQVSVYDIETYDWHYGLKIYVYFREVSNEVEVM